MKLGKQIHEIFLFYTPKLMDVYFEYLKNKIKKAVGVTTLLVTGNELPNIISESHMQDSSLPKVHPQVKTLSIQQNVVSANDSIKLELEAQVIDLNKQSKIKNFSKMLKTNQANKSCIINKKAS